MKRRDFLKSSASMVLATTMATTPLIANTMSYSRPKVLVLGGRDYFGPNLVNTLLKQQCQVTLFNRGQTNPNMFSQLAWIKGDRETSDDNGLAELASHLKTHTYDWVVDTWQKSPLAVLATAKLLKSKIGHYQYVSSISVYKDMQKKNINESYPLKPVNGLDPSAKNLRYSQRKTLSEQFLFDTLGDRASSFRSHGMRSDRTPAPIYEPYWPVRLARGGQILLPLDEPHYLQATDVNSMTEFMTKLGKQQTTGIFNVAFPTQSFKHYLDKVQRVTNVDYQPVWIPANFLKQQDILPYRNLPFWRPQLKGFYHFNVSKALNAGLVNRPLEEMVADQLKGYYLRHPQDDFKFGLHGTISKQKEKEVIKRWKEFNKIN